MKRAIQAAALAVLFALNATVPASALDRTQWYFGQNPPSQWLNFNQRQARVGFGALIHALMGNTNGFYYNLSVVAQSGLNVTVQPTSANTVGGVYQFLPEETSPFGGWPPGTGTSALAADPTQVFLQGLLAPTVDVGESNPVIGPLTPPATGGQSVDYVIECQVHTADIDSKTINLVSPSGVSSQSTANENRVDTIACQAKAGTPATTGTQVPPATDAGWVCVAFVAVANGTSTINNGMITAYQPYLGMTPQATNGYAQLTPASQQNGSINVAGPVQIGNGYVAPMVTGSGGTPAHAGHVVFLAGQTATTTGSCSANTTCSLSAGGSLTFTSGGVFDSAPACRATVTGSTVVSAVPYNTTTSTVAVAFYNMSGGAITTGTTITYSISCGGD